MSGGRVMVEFGHVFKRYARGRRGGSLRDAVPALAARLAGRRSATAAQEGDSRAFWALRDISFEVRHGEALGIIGHNGAGKSTILKLLAGVTAPTQGHARVHGRFAALIELGAGFHPDLTGRENVYLNGSILGLKRAEIDRKLDSIVDFAGLEKFVDTPVKRYSSGMYARLGFAVAAHVDPEVLLIDEVLSVGDFAFQQKCLQKMEEFRRGGVAIVFVSHNMNAITALCSKAILLRAGEIIAAGTPREVITAYTNISYPVVSDEEAEQLSGEEQARVTRHVEIVGAEMYDADERPARSFASGERATLKVHLRAHRCVREPILGIRVRNEAGVLAYETHTRGQNVSLGDMQPGDDIVVSYLLDLHLCQSTYFLTIGLAPAEGTVLLDWKEHVLSFDVFDNQKAAGIADLKASLSVSKLPAQHEQTSAADCRVASARAGDKDSRVYRVTSV